MVIENRKREQSLINIMVQSTLMIHQAYQGRGIGRDDKDTKPFFENLDDEGLMEWLRYNLDACGFKTIPMGSSWAYLTDDNYK